jgi:dipeptidyl aminopeptidase/acylaminoacyl peptidase
VRARLVAQGFADPHRIVIEGGSWGGYLTLLALGLQPSMWQAGIAVVPVADWTATYDDELEAIRAHDRALFGGSPSERPAYFAERSPITFADRIEAPVMIIGGQYDPNCPPRQIANYVERLQALGKRYAFHQFNGGHGSLDVTEQVAQHLLQLEFVRRAIA